MTATIPAAALLASKPGPAAHVALLAVVVIVGLVAFAIVRRRNTREAAEAAEAQRLDEAPRSRHEDGGPHEPPHRDSGRH